MATQTWTEQMISHLELLNQIASRLPANERLDVEQLNKILELNASFRGTFLLMCEIHGFKIEQKPPQQT
jgi:hypothetical protein